MKHYVYILIMTWASMMFIMLSSWILLLTGVNLGDFTIFAPVMVAMAGIAITARTEWFKENIREPLAETLAYEDKVEIVINIQLFTIICGLLGLGLSILCMTSFYPLGIELMLKHMARGREEWHEFAKYSPMSVISGLSFGFMFYAYLFADARGNKGMKRVVFIVGFIWMFLLGLLFGGERYFFVIDE